MVASNLILYISTDYIYYITTSNKKTKYLNI